MKHKFEGTYLGVLATIDTGTDVSVMPVRIYRQLYPHNMTGEIVQSLKPCNMKLTQLVPAFTHIVLSATLAQWGEHSLTERTAQVLFPVRPDKTYTVFC